MRKKLIGIIAMFGIALVAMGQTNDKMSLGFYKVAKYPTCPKTLTANTYRIIDVEGVSKSSSVAKALDLSFGNYFKRVNSDDAAISIQITDTLYRVSDPVIQDNLYEIANRKTQGPPPPTMYIARISKEFGFTITIKEGDRVIFSDNVNKNINIESNWSRDPKLAMDTVRVRAKKVNFTNVVRQQYLPTLKKALGTDLLLSQRLSIYSVRIKKKCTMDYSDLTKAATDFETAFEIVKDYEYDIEKFIEAAKPSVAAWEKALTESKPSVETARINKEITCGLYYNLAIYYMLIKDFTKSKENFMKAEKTAPGFGNAERMAKMVETTYMKPQADYNKMMAAAGL